MQLTGCQQRGPPALEHVGELRHAGAMAADPLDLVRLLWGFDEEVVGARLETQLAAPPQCFGTIWSSKKMTATSISS